MPHQSIDDIHSSDCLLLGVLSVGDSITDDVLKDYLEDTLGLLIDEARGTIETTLVSQVVESRLGDTLDVVMKKLSFNLTL